MNQQSNEQTPEDRLRQMLPDIRVIQMIYVAAKLGIADLLRDGPKKIEVLATATDVHAPSLYRLLRGLASLGIFTETEPRQFEMTPMAELLRSDVPGSMQNDALWLGEPWRWRPYGELIYSVRTGKPAFNHVFDMDMFDYLAQHAEADTIFNQNMTDMTTIQGAAVADTSDFSQANMVIDIGGGQGALIAAILRKFPLMQGIIFDMPEVVEGACDQLMAAGALDRCKLVGGSFFESLPKGGDIYILKHVLHDWDDERVRLILQNCRRVMKDSAKLLVIEWVIPQGNDPHFGKIVDLEMLTLFSGRERTKDEYKSLLRLSGFELTTITPTTAAIDIIEAIPVERNPHAAGDDQAAVRDG